MNIESNRWCSKVVFAMCTMTAVLPLSARAVEITVKPYITWVDKTSTTIQWETDIASSSTIEFGPTGSYGQVASSTGLTTDHKVVVENLSEENLYYYRASSTANDTTIYSSPYTFETAVGNSTPFRFAFMADTRRDSGSPIPLHTEDVANAIYAKNPKFTINSGDVTMGTDSLTVETTEQEYRTELFDTSATLMAHKPYFIAIGDHERRGVGGDQAFSKFFSGYQSPYWENTYYTFTYGNARFIMLDTIITSDHADGVEVPGIAEGSTQYNWLINVLENNTSDWTFVAHHYSTYQSADRFMARDLEMRALLGPVFDEYDVDVALLGHAHFYERTHPITGGVRDDENGTIYVTAGIGGASLSPLPPGSELTAASFNDNGYCIVDVTGEDVEFTTYDLGGSVRDHFSLGEAVVNIGTGGHWTFDDVVGSNVPDSAGGDDTGTLTGAVVVASTAPVPGGTTSAIDFDGTRGPEGIDHNIMILDTGKLSPGTGDWSYAAWINPDSIDPADDAGRQNLYGDGGVGSNYIQVFLDYNESTEVCELKAYLRDAGGTDLFLEGSGAGVAAGTWQHVAVVRDGTDLFAYLDGVEVGSATLPADFDINTTGGTNPMMGHHPSGGNYWLFKGQMDEVRIFDHALTSVELEILVHGSDLIGDANEDGVVDELDATALANNWQKAAGARWSEGDFNGDGAVDDLDATLLAANWGASLTDSTVPEPSSLVLLIGIGLASLSRFRERSQMDMGCN